MFYGHMFFQSCYKAPTTRGYLLNRFCLLTIGHIAIQQIRLSHEKSREAIPPSYKAFTNLQKDNFKRSRGTIAICITLLYELYVGEGGAKEKSTISSELFMSEG